MKSNRKPTHKRRGHGTARLLQSAAVTLACLHTLTANAAVLDPDRISWSELSFRASKFFITINADVSLADIPGGEIDGLLTDPGDGQAVGVAGPTKELVFATGLLGRDSRAAVLLNAENGATLQRTSHDSGKRNRHRIYRYTDVGAYQKTWWPVGEDEEKLPTDQWEQWSKYEEGMRPFAEAVHGQIVTDPGALLYIVGTAPLENPGDKVEIYAYARKNVHLVTIEVGGMETIKVNYEQQGGAGAGRKKGKVEALKLMVRGKMVDDGDSDDEFELLGLRGDIDIHIDPVTRAPIQIEGNVKIAGHAVMRLKRIKLAG